MFKIEQGDLLASDNDVYVHGCNCMLTMGGGIAASIAKEYPEVEAVDKLTQRGDLFKLGKLTSWTGSHARIQNKQITIVNAYTQFYPGNESEKSIIYAVRNYKAIADVMHRISVKYESLKIGMPEIGMGICGGDKKIIYGILEETFKNSNCLVTVYQWVPPKIPEFVPFQSDIL